MRNAARLGARATCVCLLMLAHTALSAASPLPTPWVSQDIGAVGLPGSASAVNGVFTVNGSGADIWGAADAFQAVMEPISGDVQIVARVASIQNTNTYAKAGIMLRGSLTAGSAHVILDLRPNGSIEFMTRSANGGSTTWLAGSTQPAPAWLKLTRTGTTVTGYVSSNGSAWTQVGSTTLSIPAAAYAGLAVTSHDTTKLNKSTFDNIAVTGASILPALPAPWTNQDVGAVGVAGNTTYAAGVFTVSGAGADIWGTADAFQAVSQPLPGDVQLIARVKSVENTNTYAKAGIMLRDSLAPGAVHVILDLRPNGAIEFMKRSTTNGATTWLASTTQPAPAWLKLTRSGSTVTGYASSDGTTWTQVGTTSVTFGASPVGALTVTSHDTTQLNTSTFDNVSAGPLPVVVPPPSAPSSPSPADSTTNLSAASTTMTWTAAGATSYDVRFGATNPPPQVAAGIASASYTASNLLQGATYYWQIVANNASGSTPGSVWSFATQAPPPTVPASPAPVSGATSVAASSVALSWASSGAASYDVYFGTTNPPALAAANVAASTYTVASLQQGTSYYWQVVAKNGTGATAGPVWTFATVVAPPSSPSSPSPVSGATGLSAASLALSWSAAGATSYDVYFGTTNPPALAASSLSTATYSVSSLQAGTSYFWQVVATNAGGSTAGPVWSFAMQVGPPAAPSSPSPAAGATGVDGGSVMLTWTANDATSFDVLFGTTNPPTQVASNILTPSYSVSSLPQNTAYYWQIVAKNAGGSTPGAVWSFTTAGGKVWNVPAGGDLQGALNAAQAGDVIVLQAGATYIGNFTLPAKSSTSTDYITITSSGSALPGETTRMDPSYAPQLAKIQSPNSSPAIATVPYAHHYRLVNLEFRANFQGFGDVIDFGDGSSAQNTLAGVPHDLVADRLYIHGDPTYGQKRGIGLNSASSTVKNSYIASIMAVGQDSQAVCGWNGPGPYTVDNNYLEAAGENLLFGGADPAIPQLVPSDITITNNYFSKQLSWKGSSWQVKNLLELKNAQRVLINGNTLEYNWLAAQAGSSILFTPRNQDGTAPWSIVQHVQFTNNVVRHVSSAFNILGRDNLQPSLLTNDIVIRNNLIYDVSAAKYGGTGRLLLINGGQNITLDHNTVFEDGSTDLYAVSAVTGFTFTNNILQNNAWAIMGDNASPGNGTIAMYFSSGGLFQDSIIVAAPAGSYPTGNFYPATMSGVGFMDYANGNYRLSPSSSYKGAATDGTDIGADIDAINAAAGTSF